MANKHLEAMRRAVKLSNKQLSVAIGASMLVDPALNAILLDIGQQLDAAIRRFDRFFQDEGNGDGE